MSSLPRQFIFNGDNKQVEVKKDGLTIGRYFYDGEGKRVKKITDTETTVFVYSSGKLIAEYSTQLSQTPSVAYLTNDHLGSPRVITDEFGQVRSRRDFMPFGEELYTGVGGRNETLKYGSGEDNVRQKFTGYQKDTETDLDFAEARMYETKHGRFTAVDPLLASGKSANPQTFNRYIYVTNNPLAYVDPTGLDGCQAFGTCNSPGPAHERERISITPSDSDPPQDPPPSTVTATVTTMAVHPSCMNASRCVATEPVTVDVAITEISTGVTQGTPTNPDPNEVAPQSRLLVSITANGQPLEGSVTESVRTREDFNRSGMREIGTIVNPGSVELVNGQMEDFVVARGGTAHAGFNVPQTRAALENSIPNRIEQTATFTVATNPYQVAGGVQIVHSRSLSNYSSPYRRNPVVNQTRFRLTHSGLSVTSP